MSNHMIYIKNGIGSNKPYAQQKISVKNSNSQQKQRLKTNNNTPKNQLSNDIDNGIRTGGGLITSASSLVQGNPNQLLNKTLFKSIGGTAVLLKAVESAIDFGINLEEAKTGNTVQSHNSRAILNTATSLGMNYISSGLETMIFTSRIISRENYSKDYNRDIYNMQNFGEKYKVR